MISLVLSIIALFTGVAIYPFVKRHASLLSFFDAFALVSLLGLTLMHLIPHSVENGGIAGMISVLVGCGIPALLHHFQHHDHDEAHDTGEDHGHRAQGILLILVFVGVIIHTLLDGIGLSMANTESEMGAILGIGVLFHRLPVGIFLSLMLVPRIGLKKSWAVAGAFAVSTLAGFLLGHFALPGAGIRILYIVQGLIAGALLHIVFHNVSVEGHQESHWPKGIGALAGFAALAIVEWVAPEHGHDHGSVLDTWLAYLGHAAPAWCVCLAVIGLLYAFGRSKTPRLAAFGQNVLNYLDPQPLPAAFEGKPHFAGATGIVILWMLFSFASLGIWWMALAMCLVLFHIAVRPVVCCEHCRPESLCDREKSFHLWAASSWTVVAGTALLASVLPAFLEPVSDLTADMPAWAAIAIFVITVLLMLGRMGAKRGLAPGGTILAMFALTAAFLPLGKVCMLIPFFGIVSFILYDFHPRDIAASRIEDKPWMRRYLIASVLSIFVMAGAFYAGMRYFEHQDDPLAAITTIEPVHAHHHEHVHVGEHEHEHEHAHEDEHAQEHEHEHAQENEHEHAQPAAAEWFTGLPLYQRLALLAFLLTGFAAMLRMGPRSLFETALGRSHHEHE